jgi:hypothetical protein
MLQDDNILRYRVISDNGTSGRTIEEQNLITGDASFVANVSASGAVKTNYSGSYPMAVTNSYAGQTWFYVKNTNTAGSAGVIAYNDNEAGYFAGATYGSNYGVTSWRNAAGFFSKDKMFFGTNGNVTSGGSSNMSFMTGGNNYPNNVMLHFDTPLSNIEIGTYKAVNKLILIANMTLNHLLPNSNNTYDIGARSMVFNNSFFTKVFSFNFTGYSPFWVGNMWFNNSETKVIGSLNVTQNITTNDVVIRNIPNTRVVLGGANNKLYSSGNLYYDGNYLYSNGLYTSQSTRTSTIYITSISEGNMIYVGNSWLVTAIPYSNVNANGVSLRASIQVPATITNSDLTLTNKHNTILVNTSLLACTGEPTYNCPHWVNYNECSSNNFHGGCYNETGGSSCSGTMVCSHQNNGDGSCTGIGCTDSSYCSGTLTCNAAYGQGDCTYIGCSWGNHDCWDNPSLDCPTMDESTCGSYSAGCQQNYNNACNDNPTLDCPTMGESDCNLYSAGCTAVYSCQYGGSGSCTYPDCADCPDQGSCDSCVGSSGYWLFASCSTTGSCSSFDCDPCPTSYGCSSDCNFASCSTTGSCDTFDEGNCPTSYGCGWTADYCYDGGGQPTTACSNFGNGDCTTYDLECDWNDDCSGSPTNDDCHQWDADQTNCEMYSSHHSDCSWLSETFFCLGDSTCQQNQGYCQAESGCVWEASKNVNIYLPSCASNVGQEYKIKKTINDAGNVYVVPYSINGCSGTPGSCSVWNSDESGCINHGCTPVYGCTGEAGGCSSYPNCMDCNQEDCGNCGGTWTRLISCGGTMSQCSSLPQEYCDNGCTWGTIYNDKMDNQNTLTISTYLNHTYLTCDGVGNWWGW